MGWETAVLEGGPADGMRLRVCDEPAVLQVGRPCPAEQADGNGEQPGRERAEGEGDVLLVQALYVYRRLAGRPLRYGFDPASP